VRQTSESMNFPIFVICSEIEITFTNERIMQNLLIL